MLIQFFLFICLALFPSRLGEKPRAREELIIWNVGQGSWASRVSAGSCLHFDTGGERFPRALTAVCAGRRNELHYSHWDWDHVGFLGRLRANLNEFCLAKPPAGKGSPRKLRLFAGLRSCPDRTPEIPTSPRIQIRHSSNEVSRVFLLENRILLPGDSTARAEKFWALDSRVSSVRLLILGHHGSRTSTSGVLLDHLPHLRQAVASCRHAKYGHPHPIIVRRLRERGVALITTEDWGHLHFGVR